jgi:hypothetical protein
MSSKLLLPCEIAALECYRQPTHNALSLYSTLCMLNAITCDVPNCSKGDDTKSGRARAEPCDILHPTKTKNRTAVCTYTPIVSEIGWKKRRCCINNNTRFRSMRGILPGRPQAKLQAVCHGLWEGYQIIVRHLGSSRDAHACTDG